MLSQSCAFARDLTAGWVGQPLLCCPPSQPPTRPFEMPNQTPGHSQLQQCLGSVSEPPASCRVSLQWEHWWGEASGAVPVLSPVVQCGVSGPVSHFSPQLTIVFPSNHTNVLPSSDWRNGHGQHWKLKCVQLGGGCCLTSARSLVPGFLFLLPGLSVQQLSGSFWGPTPLSSTQEP